MFLSDDPAFSLSFLWPGYGKMYPIPGITTDIQLTSAPAEVICLAFLKRAAAELRATAGLRISLPQDQAVAPEKPGQECPEHHFLGSDFLHGIKPAHPAITGSTKSADSSGLKAASNKCCF